MLYQIEGFFAQKSDSAMQILDTLNVKALSEKEQAHYCLLKVKVRDAFYLYDDETDSLLQVAENYFVGGKDKWFEAETCEAFSRIASKEGKGEQIKLKWLLKALQSMEQCQHVDERLIQYHSVPISEEVFIENYTYTIHRLLGMTYSEYGYLKEGYGHLKTAYLHFEKTQEYEQCSKAAYMLGHFYLGMGEYDSCLMCYHNGLEAAKMAGDVKQCAYYHYSMCMYYKYKCDHQTGLDAEEKQQLLWKCVAECKKGLALLGESNDHSMNAYYSGLSNSFYFLKEYDSCVYYANKELVIMADKSPTLFPNKVHAGVLYRIYKSYSALGDSENALFYADCYFKMQHALEDEPKAIEQVKNEYDKKLEMLQLQNKQQVKQFRLYLLLALVLLSLVVVLWISNRYRKNKEIEILRQKEAYRKLESEFESASQHSLQALQQRVMELYKTGGNDRLERIIAEFEASYPFAKEKIKTNYPNLTESELNIVVLSFLGFRMKEEADILNLSQNTVEKYRSNIRKKAGSNPVSFLI